MKRIPGVEEGSGDFFGFASLGCFWDGGFTEILFHVEQGLRVCSGVSSPLAFSRFVSIICFIIKSYNNPILRLNALKASLSPRKGFE